MMTIQQSYPVLMSHRVSETAAFYRRHFDLAVRFESDWYVHLQSDAQPQINLAILDSRHESVPAVQRGQISHGVLLNFEVGDVDAVHARFTAVGLPMLLPLRSEPWGQRHFITADPNGVMVDVITPIAPSAEFAAQYQADGN